MDPGSGVHWTVRGPSVPQQPLPLGHELPCLRHRRPTEGSGRGENKVVGVGTEYTQSSPELVRQVLIVPRPYRQILYVLILHRCVTKVGDGR